MKVYHGTSLYSAINIQSRGILLSKAKEYTDFYKGFYTSEYFEYAKNTALHKKEQSKLRNSTFIPAVIEFDYEDKYDFSLKYLTFQEEDINWLQFIINNRNGIAYVEKMKQSFHNLSCKYDIVSGRVADGNIVIFAEELRKNNQLAKINDLANIIYKNNPFATQISFHSTKAIKKLNFCRIIKEEEFNDKK